jgi:hypothetical protein
MRHSGNADEWSGELHHIESDGRDACCDSSLLGKVSYDSTTTNATAAIVTQGTDAIALSLSGPNTVALGAPITLKEGLGVASLEPAPTGTVALLDGTAAIGTAMSSGSAPIALNFAANTPSRPLTAGPRSFSLN